MSPGVIPSHISCTGCSTSLVGSCFRDCYSFVLHLSERSDSKLPSYTLHHLFRISTARKSLRRYPSSHLDPKRSLHLPQIWCTAIPQTFLLHIALPVIPLLSRRLALLNFARLPLESRIAQDHRSLHFTVYTRKPPPWPLKHSRQIYL